MNGINVRVEPTPDISLAIFLLSKDAQETAVCKASEGSHQNTIMLPSDFRLLVSRTEK
jgi:hypothetical protein